MRCLVTGGSGFIGSYIAEELIARGDSVLVLDEKMPRRDDALPVKYVAGDVRDWGSVMAAMEDIDEVYHCSGMLGTEELIARSQAALQVNVGGALNVLECARLKGVARVFFPTKPNEWLNTYSITKYAAEQFALMYSQVYGLRVSLLKWFNAYGPRQHCWPIRKAVPTFIFCALTGRPLPVFGSGEQTVDMIYVSDVARIAVEATRGDWYPGEVVDLGSSEPITVNQLAQAVLDACPSASSVSHEPMREGEPIDTNICADSRILTEHDIELTPIREGMSRTVAYYASRVSIGEMEWVLDNFGIKSENECG